MIQESTIHAKINFVYQQGFTGTPRESYLKYPSLVFQPRVLFIAFCGIVLFDLGVRLFYGSLLLAFCAAFPKWNPFDYIYRWVDFKKALHASPALAPRRFAQLLASILCLIAFVASVNSWSILYWITTTIILVASGISAFGNNCSGAVIYYAIRGKHHLEIPLDYKITVSRYDLEEFNNPVDSRPIL